MRILIIASYYIPDGGPAGQLYRLLCDALVKRGHQVTVLTSVPHYPSGRIPEEYLKKKTYRTRENGVEIIRVWLPSVDRANLPSRALQFIAFQLNTVLAGMSLKYDIVLSHSPALESLIPFIYFSIIRNKPSVYSVHDVYPDVGIKLGIFRSRFVINIVEWMEKICLLNSKRIRILSSSFYKGLNNLNINQKKIELIYDWVDTDAISQLPKENQFSLEYKLNSSFVVAYIGNLGLVQGLDSILESAKLLISQEHIRFVFIGDGSNKTHLLEKINLMHLDNVQFIPYQPIERMSEVFASADLVLVSLSKGTSFGALPSKTYSIMASGKPIIGCLDEGSEARELIERAKAGICIDPEEPEQLAEAITKLKNDPKSQKEFGRNGREYVEKYHSPEKAAIEFEKLFLEIVNNKTNG